MLCAGRWMYSGLTLALLSGCSVLQPQGPASDHRMEQRVQALEADVQVLTERLNALQPDNVARGAGMHAMLPPDARPVRPAIILASHTIPVPASLAPVASAPVQETVTSPVAQAVTTPPAVAHPAQDGWVINLASYTNETYAADKRTEFAGDGIEVELVEATVRGSAIYRLRVPGFASYREASAEAQQIQQRLGLQDTWVARAR